MMREEGLDAGARAPSPAGARRCAPGAQALGFRCSRRSPSHSVTSLMPPDGVDAAAVVKRLRDVHGIVVAGGQDQLKGKIFRVGHMGAYDLADIHVMLGALEECVAALGGPTAGAAARPRPRAAAVASAA